MTISVIIVTSVIIYIAYIVSKTIKTFEALLQNIKEAGDSISILKDGIQIGIFKLASDILSKLQGGDDNG